MPATPYRVAVASLLVLMVVGGCQRGRGTLEGKVSYQGKQVVQAAAVLDAGDGVPRVAGLAEDGTYRFDNVPAGNVRLAVISPDPAKQPAPSLDENGNPMPIPKVDRSRWFPLPETLTDPRTSDLTTTVRPGQNTFDIIVH